MTFLPPHALLGRIAYRPTALAAVVAVAALAPAVGCNRGPEMYHVSGTVKYQDGSVPRAGVCLVRFEPSRNSAAPIRKGANGAIAEDGSFELFTRIPGDGVHPGEYAVVFTVCRSAVDTTPLIAEKYANPNLSPYKVTVDGDQHDLVFEIEALN